MYLVVPVRLYPDKATTDRLSATAEAFRRACRHTSERAVGAKVYHPVALQQLVYRELKEKFGLGAQTACLCVRAVTAAHKVGDRDKVRDFKGGAVPFDLRTYSLSLEKEAASLWTTTGRVKVRFAVGEAHRERLAGIRKQADLVCRRGKWMLLVTVEVPEAATSSLNGSLGVDLGITNIATDSDGHRYSGAVMNGVRHRHRRLRARLQKKGTRSAKRRLRRLSGKEHRFATWVNHNISRAIVRKASGTGRGIAVEDLTGIRKRVTAQKAKRATLHSWAFAQLRQFIAYKSALAGVPLVAVNPAYTSQTCAACGHCEKANRNGEQFHCLACGHQAHADHNAADNIRRAAANQPYARGRGAAVQSPRL